MIFAKVLLCLLTVGGITKVDVPPEFEGQRNLAVVLVILYNIFIPFGNYYGLALILTLAVYGCCILFECIAYPQLRDREIERLSHDLSRTNMFAFSMERRAKLLEKELINYRESSMEDKKEIAYLLHILREKAVENPDKFSDNNYCKELLDLLDLLLEKYNEPIIKPRVINIALFDNLTSRRKKKYAIKYLKNVRKDVNFGTGFDSELKTYIYLLEKELNKDVRRRI